MSKDNIVTRNEEKPEKMKENANPNTNIQTKTDLKK